MAFESLSEKLKSVFKQLNSKGSLTEKDVKEALREVKLALLEADVNFRVVKDFVNKVTEKAIGEAVLKSLTPGQQVIKIVNGELTELLGSANAKLTFSSKPPTVYMLAGLQGAGKTTAAGKLACYLKKQNKKPLLAACDIYRPAAIKQLQVVGNNYNIPVFSMGDKISPVDIAKAALSHAKDNYFDVVILDTAGRLHINEELMAELTEIKTSVFPQEILLVIDAMTGQDAVTVAQSFNEQLGLDGIIITKLDGDTRGGAALSIRHVTGKPIKFVGMGEKASDLEAFYPDRMASRILGMGDVLSLIEKAQSAFDQKEAMELEKKMRTNEFSLEDFLSQLQQVKKMGSIKDILGMIPGMGNLNIKDEDINDKDFAFIEAIIRSMTPQERRNPHILNGSRKKRIASGSGRSIQEVNRLLKQFEEMKKMMKTFTEASRGKRGKMRLPFM
ncbi:MAG: signal recognition particle protein [Clostridiales bacterium]|jgi:signal recognition particle subunit SRP54|nr:signal recognition particle protein [Clostridiales bacterium]